jgi:N-acetylneuraminic acid mutarotase
VYRAQYGLPACTTANGCFRKVAQDGSTNYPPADSSWASEESLDVDMVSAICPNCHILLVEANDSSIENLGTAVNEAVALGAKYVSNSYGGSEDPSETAADNAYYNHPGVAMTVSSGDYGYGAYYPAASQYVTAVGGTTLSRDSSVTRGWAESAWAGAGSGCSTYDPKPSWQKDTGCANRTIADVSAVADPNTGVAVYDSYGAGAGGWGVWGGTSVASPVIASTYALAGSPETGTYPASYLYADTAALNDVTSGRNGYCSPAYLCTAGTGYDGPTGLGTPNGVAAFTGGPHGDVSGTVTDASTGKPIADAEVDVGTQPGFTNSSGAYDIFMPVGTYTVTAKPFGYAPQTDNGVAVTDGQTTTENFSVQPVPTVTLSGQVTDGSGHGWPLYAKVSVPGTPAVAYTDPATGKYTLTMPVNSSYTVRVDAVYPGYQQAQQSVQVGTSNLTQDFSVPVDASTCSALGYHYSYNGATQTFDGTSVPAGWSVVNASGTTNGWEFDDPQSLTNNTGGSGNFAVADSLAFGNEDSELITPVTDLSQDTSPVLQFNSDDQAWFGDTEAVDVSTDGGQTWTNVWTGPGFPGKPGPDLETIPLPKAAGQSQVQVRFHYVSDYGYDWELDNVFLGQRDCTPAPGGLVEGVVTDGNTGAGVSGATVTNAGQTATTAATGDPGVGDGFYYMFLPGTGSQQFTAAKRNYVTATGTATVTADAVTPVNFTLQAGQLSVTPGTVSETMAMGSSTTQDLKFTDTGKAPVNVKLYEQPAGFTMLGEQPSATGAPVQHVNGTFSPYSAEVAKNLGGGQAPAAQPSGAPWTAVANYPTFIMDNAAATDPSTGLVYSVGGYHNYSNRATTDGYVYDPGTQQWTALPAMQYAREAPQAAFINGKLYVVGGWDNSGTPVSYMEIYNPDSGTWSFGASIPTAYAAASVAVLNGKMYVIGGCDSLTCGHTGVQVYDPASNSWSTAASYPEPTSWEGCGAITGQVYCAGGTVASLTGETTTKDAYVYDPASDAWYAIAPLPIDLWGMGYSAANGKLLISGGVTNQTSTLTNQGFAYDPSSGSWSALPNSNNLVFRGGSACGLYRIGGSDAVGYAPYHLAEQLPGYGSCGVTKVGWMSESTDSFTVNPGTSVTVTVTLNAGDPSVTQPGAYAANLLVSDDTPYSTSPVGLTMNATPPHSWGKITGTVSGLECNGTTVPLPGAAVQIDGSATSYTLKTDKNGSYALWLDHRNDPLTVVASLSNWQSQTATVKIKEGSTATADFTLKTDQTCA